MFASSRQIIGVAFKTYIIVQDEDIVYFIDQHAGHERLLFDKFNEQLKHQTVQVQDLLLPFVLNVNDKESEYIESHLEELSSQGFEISLFGKNSYRITSVPMLLNGVNLGEYFDEVLLNLNNRLKNPQEMSRHMIATMACKAAVKAGNKLSEGEINFLLDELKKNNNTLLCPHGRPIVITFDKKQLEKMFKRKPIIIPGFKMKTIIVLSKLLPRKLSTHINYYNQQRKGNNDWVLGFREIY